MLVFGGKGSVRRVFYGWWIVAASLVALMVGSGLTFWSFTVYIPPLEDEFGWSRAQVSSAFSVGVIVSGICAPIAGRVIDRVGARRTIAIGSLGLVGTFILFSRVQTLWQYLAVFGLQSFVSAWVMFMPFQWLVAQWFVRRRGLAIGIATSGFGLGGSFMLPLIAFFIERWGWRASYQISGLLVLVFYLPVALVVVRNRPQDMGLNPDGDPTPATTVAPVHAGGERRVEGSRAWSLRDLVHARSFWLLALAQMFFFGAFTSFGLHSIPFFESEGYSAAYGATVIAITSLVRTPLRIFAGWALDRTPTTAWLACGVSLLPGVALLALTVSTEPLILAGFAITWALGGSVLPMLLSLTSARTFGAGSFATVTGGLLAVETIAAVSLPPLGGLLFDRTGSYDLAFALYAVSFTAAAVTWWFLLADRAAAQAAALRAEPEPARRGSA